MKKSKTAPNTMSMRKPASASAEAGLGVSEEGQVQGLLSPFISCNGDWTSVPKATKSEILESSTMNMDKLFGPDAGTGFLIEQCLTWFTVDDGEGKDLDWFVKPDPVTKIGEHPAFEPSPFNRDLQEQTCEEYKQRLLLEGQPQSVAGRVTFVLYVVVCLQISKTCNADMSIFFVLQFFPFILFIYSCSFTSTVAAFFY